MNKSLSFVYLKSACKVYYFTLEVFTLISLDCICHMMGLGLVFSTKVLRNSLQLNNFKMSQTFLHLHLLLFLTQKMEKRKRKFQGNLIQNSGGFLRQQKHFYKGACLANIWYILYYMKFIAFSLYLIQQFQSQYKLQKRNSQQ